MIRPLDTLSPIIVTMNDSHSTPTAPGPPRTSADHTLTPVNSHPTSNVGSTMVKKVSPGHEAEADHHEQAALEHVGAGADLAMGSPRRMKIEKRLKLKLDLRMSILVSSGKTASIIKLTRSGVSFLRRSSWTSADSLTSTVSSIVSQSAIYEYTR